MSATVESAVEGFLAHKRALGRKYQSEEHELRLLARFAAEQHVGCLDELTPAMIEEFLASRPRSRPRSFNHLLGVLRGLLGWAVTHELLSVSPLQARPRRVTSVRVPFLFDAAMARRLLDAAAALPDNPRARQRGPTYHAIFALCYGLGLRAGEACGLRLGDIDTGRNLLIVRGGKFGKTRLVPHGPRIAALVGKQAERRRAAARPGPTHRCSPSTGTTASTLARPAWSSTGWPGRSASPCWPASHRRPCTVCGTRLPSDACSAGTGKAWTRQPGFTSCQRSWDMSTLPPRRST